MAKQQKVTYVYTDDLTGEALTDGTVETVEFALDGVGYELDLSADNASSLRNDFAAWVGHARKTSSRQAPARRKAVRSSDVAATGDREQNAAIREWARKHGHQVSERGRIRASVVEAFHQAV